MNTQFWNPLTRSWEERASFDFGVIPVDSHYYVNAGYLKGRLGKVVKINQHFSTAPGRFGWVDVPCLMVTLEFDFKPEDHVYTWQGKHITGVYQQGYFIKMHGETGKMYSEHLYLPDYTCETCLTRILTA